MDTAIQHLSGRLVGIDVTNPREVTYQLQRYMDEHGKPPSVIAVNTEAPEFELPEKFEGLGVHILRRQWIHHIKVAIVGVLS